MKIITLVFALSISLTLSGCQSLGDEWAKSASNTFLKMTGNNNSANNASGTGTGGANSSGNTTGSITLSGPDTSMVGTTLDTGFVGTSIAAGSQPNHIAIVDRLSTVTFNAPNILIPNNVDPSNGFVLVVTDDSPSSGIKGISMSIVISGAKYDYLCTTVASRSMIHCGSNSITLDIANKSVTLNNVNVENADTKTVLTLAGQLSW